MVRFASSLCKNTKAKKENLWLFLQSITVFMHYLKYSGEKRVRTKVDLERRNKWLYDYQSLKKRLKLPYHAPYFNFTTNITPI